MSQGGWIFMRPTLNGPLYWLGRMKIDGLPLTTPRRDEAFSFQSMWGAMQTAETHDALRNSTDWKVVMR